MPDPYSNPDEQPESAIQAMATRLEERGRHDGFSRMISTYVQTLPTDRPLRVLDLGCGTGVVTRQLIESLAPGSEVHGGDVSAELLKQAKLCSPNSGIIWDHLPSGPLPYADETFDAVTMHTLLSHVPNPLSILAESKRILKPDGRLIVFDADHAGTTYSQSDFEKTRRMDHLLISAIATNPDVCRQLPRLFKESGFGLSSHCVDVISECCLGDYWLSSVEGFARLIPTLGAVSANEGEAWVKHMRASHEDGTFFAAGAFYTFHAHPVDED
ncbi:MAG: methyltransferase domain-containing protein [Verrucomicrobiota bacterium]